MFLGLEQLERDFCLAACPEPVPLCFGSRCEPVPVLEGEVFRYDQSAVPVTRFVVATSPLGLVLDGLGSRVHRVPRLDRLDERKDVGELRWDLYLERDGCALRIGSYRGAAQPVLANAVSKGLRTFRVPEYSTDAGEHGVRIYTFNGRNYVEGPWRPR